MRKKKNTCDFVVKQNYAYIVALNKGLPCDICGIQSFDHFHRAGTLPKNFESDVYGALGREAMKEDTVAEARVLGIEEGRQEVISRVLRYSAHIDKGVLARIIAPFTERDGVKPIIHYVCGGCQDKGIKKGPCKHFKK